MGGFRRRSLKYLRHKKMNGSFCVNEKRDCNKEDEVKTSKFVILQIVIRRREINA